MKGNPVISLPDTAQAVINMLKKAGFQAYAVGGSVRDLLMGRPTKGWDFTTNAKPEEILAIFPDSFYDNQFGTVGIKMYEGLAPDSPQTDPAAKPADIFEVTTYRSEQGYSDRRHPDTITWGTTLAGDLSRRDFTVNAIAFDGTDLVDPYGGQKDIKEKIIRAVGEPGQRFSEDALRMMRAVRQASELGFAIEEKTLAAAQANAALIRDISAERIRDELLRLLASPFAADGILVLKSAGILALVLPELDATFAVGQKSPKRHHLYDVGTHSVLALKNCPSPDPIVRLATLLHDIGKTETYRKDESGLVTFFNHEVVGANLARGIAARLRLSKNDSFRLYALIRWHQFSVDERQTDSAIRRFIRHVGKENLDNILDLRIGDRLGGGARETSWRLELYKKRIAQVQVQPFSVADLAVDGHDVMDEFGIPPGPVIGKALNALFAEVDAGTLPNDRDKLLARLRDLKPTLLG